MFITPEQFLIAPNSFNFFDTTTLATKYTCNSYGAKLGFSCDGCLFCVDSHTCSLYYIDNPDLQSSVDNFRQTNPEYFI